MTPKQQPRLKPKWPPISTKKWKKIKVEVTLMRCPWCHTKYKTVKTELRRAKLPAKGKK